MPNKIIGGPADGIVSTSTAPNGANKGGHSLTLKFIEDEDKDLYAAMVADAKKDRRPLDQFVVLYLLANYPHNQLAEVSETKSTVE